MFPESSDLDYLIPYVRLRVGDLNSESYSYLDEWIRASLISALKTLNNWWNHKYILDDSYVVTRNSASVELFLFDSPPVIEHKDEQALLIMACIILLEGSLENSSWDAVSWKDSEISFSNLEKYRTKSTILKNLTNELENLLLPPTKRLAQPYKGSLPGYLKNKYENGDNI